MKTIYKKSLVSILSITMCFGVMAVSACSSDLMEEDNSNMVTFDVWGNTIAYSSVFFNQVTLNGEDGSVFECSIGSSDGGKFIVISDTYTGGTQVTVDSGSTIYWSYRTYDEDNYMHISQSDVIWLDFINKYQSKIIGYAVVKVEKIADYNYEPQIVKSVTFPKVHGIYQSVSEKQVEELIENAKQS